MLLELRYFFVKILKPYITDLKHDVTMLLHQGHCLICVCSCMNFHCQNVRGSYRGLKKSYFMWQKHGVTCNMSLTHKS